MLEEVELRIQFHYEVVRFLLDEVELRIQFHYEVGVGWGRIKNTISLRSRAVLYVGGSEIKNTISIPYSYLFYVNYFLLNSKSQLVDTYVFNFPANICSYFVFISLTKPIISHETYSCIKSWCRNLWKVEKLSKSKITFFLLDQQKFIATYYVSRWKCNELLPFYNIIMNWMF